MIRTRTSRSLADHGRFRDDGGFTLLESVVAFSLFMTVVTFGGIAIRDTIKLTGVTSARVSAANIATQELERLRLANLTGHALQLTAPNQAIPTGFAVTDTTGTCASGTLPLTVAVTWGDGTRTVTYDSELAC